jgi:outer membrane usher protein
MARVVLAVLLASATLAAAAGQPQQAFWSLVVNDVAKDEVLAVVDGDRMWLPVAALEKAGLKGFAGDRAVLFGAPHVLLRSLEPDITTRLDNAEVAIHLTAAPRFFQEQTFTLQRERPEGITYSHSPSGFLNYSATWDHTAGTSGYGEAGMAMFGSSSFSSGFSVDADGRVVRGLSLLTVDRPTARQRLQVGDIVSSSTPLGSGPIIAGVSFGRDYSVDPYYYRFPTPVVRGTATSPSDVEIYVNGALVRRMPIAPGPYRFDRLPLNTGRGDVRVVVRDRLGREQVQQSGVYLASGVLRKGEMDYQYLAGALRDDTTGVPVYGDWQATVAHRVGLADWLTVGYAGEGNQDVAAGGPVLSMRVGRLGELEVNAWGSRMSDNTRGFAWYGIYSYTSSWLTLGATGQYYGDGYANIYQTPGSASTPEFYQATAGVPLRRAGSVNYTWEVRRSPAGTFGFALPDGSFDESIVRSLAHTLRVNLRVFPNTQLSTTATLTNVRGQQQWTGFAGLNIVVSRATTASVTYSRLATSESTYADINRSLPAGVGYGYRVTASDVDGGTASGQFEAHLPRARVRFNYDAMQGGDVQNGSATIAGGLIATRGGVFLTRELESSVAVVEVTGLKNVHILADNVPIGRTNRRGRLLIPELLPYLANQISYDEGDIPFDYKVPVTSQLVAPPFRGAAYVKFQTARIQGRAGSIRLDIDGQEVVPSYGVITVPLNGEDVESPLNSDGEFFLDLPDGRHRATVTFKGRSCTVEFEAKASAQLVQQLGRLRCTP